MQGSLHTYSMVIREHHLDSFHHVNNAMYLTLLEQARWDLMIKNGYGIEKIKATGLGPTILEINIQFLKELRLNDTITIETQIRSYTKKIVYISQKIIRDVDICCTAELTTCLFSLEKRKIVPLTPDWLHAIGANLTS